MILRRLRDSRRYNRPFFPKGKKRKKERGEEGEGGGGRGEEEEKLVCKV